MRAALARAVRRAPVSRVVHLQALNEAHNYLKDRNNLLEERAADRERTLASLHDAESRIRMADVETENLKKVRSSDAVRGWRAPPRERRCSRHRPAVWRRRFGVSTRLGGALG